MSRTEHHGRRALLIEGETSLDLVDLDARARSLASALSDRGIAAGGRVIVSTPNRIEWFIANRALGLIGALQISMNPRFTADEVAATAARCSASAAIIDMPDVADVVTALCEAGVRHVIAVDDVDLSGVLHLSDLMTHSSDLPAGTDPVETEVVVYTSGTSGVPKGARRATAHIAPQLLREYVESTQTLASSRHDRGADQCFMVSMPLSHASGSKQVIEALYGGGKVVLQRRFDALEAIDLIARYGVTDWHVVPVMLRRLFQVADELGRGADLDSLCEVTIGGAPVPQQLIDESARRLGPDVLCSGYGSTETGMVTGITARQLRERPTSCGRPFAHVSVEIRSDAGLAILQPEQAGEIWVRTPRVITGYLDEGPLGPDQLDDRGFFRTGDMGRIDADGFLYIVGRRVDMIITGGVNLYPAEIEGHLRRHPGVVDAAVVGAPHDEMGEIPVAFIETEVGAHVTEADVLDFAKRGLARFKRPHRVTVVESLPRNTSGKVVKSALDLAVPASADRPESAPHAYIRIE